MYISYYKKKTRQKLKVNRRSQQAFQKQELQLRSGKASEAKIIYDQHEVVVCVRAMLHTNLRNFNNRWIMQTYEL